MAVGFNLNLLAHGSRSLSSMFDARMEGMEGAEDSAPLALDAGVKVADRAHLLKQRGDLKRC